MNLSLNYLNKASVYNNSKDYSLNLNNVLFYRNFYETVSINVRLNLINKYDFQDFPVSVYDSHIHVHVAVFSNYVICVVHDLYGNNQVII